MKKNIIDKISLILLKQGYTIKILNSCFDVLARKNENLLLIKAVEDANSLNKENLNEMRKISFYARACMLIICDKAGVKIEDNVVYSRNGIYTVNANTLETALNHKLPFIRTGKTGLIANLRGDTLKDEMEIREISVNSLSKKVGVSASMIRRYENGEKEISLNNAVKIYNLFGGSVFEPINIFNIVGFKSESRLSGISKKYVSLGFDTSDTKKAPFNVVARKNDELILTVVGDNVNKELNLIADLFDADNLVIFKNKKPKDIPALSREEFFEIDKAKELIKVIKEF